MTDRDRLIELIKCSSQYIYEQDSLIKLIADFLLANGVIVPPCKVGDTVYALSHFKSGVLEREIKRIIYDKQGAIFDLGNMVFPAYTLGKFLFLTKEEAEEKLKELGK